MARQTVFYKWQQEHGTDVDSVNQLAEDYKNKDIDKDAFKARYGFDRKTCSGFLENRKLIVINHRGPTTSEIAEGPSQFIVNDSNHDTQKGVNRSITITQGVMDRLKALESAKPQYTHRDILNQLLDDALKQYGY